MLNTTLPKFLVWIKGMDTRGIEWVNEWMNEWIKRNGVVLGNMFTVLSCSFVFNLFPWDFESFPRVPRIRFETNVQFIGGRNNIHRFRLTAILADLTGVFITAIFDTHEIVSTVGSSFQIQIWKFQFDFGSFSYCDVEIAISVCWVVWWVTWWGDITTWTSKFIFTFHWNIIIRMLVIENESFVF